METLKIIVLRTIKHSEADLIVQGLTQNGARQSFMAKSALKSRKRFGGGVLEPTHFIECVCDRQRDPDRLRLLKEARLLKGFERLRLDYQRLELALYFLSTMNKLSFEGVEDAKENFDLLGHALTALETSAHLSELRTLFELKLLHSHGVLPPDLDLGAFEKLQIKDHNQVKVRQDEFIKLKTRTQLILNQYMSSGVGHS